MPISSQNRRPADDHARRDVAAVGDRPGADEALRIAATFAVDVVVVGFLLARFVFSRSAPVR
jgi:hypothetical protein